MTECSFCGVLEEKHYPLCYSCGSMRYPVEKGGVAGTSRQDKLKLSVSVAAAVIIPGAFIFLAANHINSKIKDRRL